MNREGVIIRIGLIILAALICISAREIKLAETDLGVVILFGVAMASIMVEFYRRD